MKSLRIIPLVALSCIAACSSVSEPPADERGTGVQGAESDAHRPSPGHYTLVLGDSYAFGWQPFKDNSDARNFSTGFATLFVARLNKSRPGLHAEEINLACPGETSVTFLEGECFYVGLGFPLHFQYEGSQLKAAKRFLRTHSGQVNPVILTLGLNDVAFMYAIDCNGDQECARAMLPAVLNTLSGNLDRTLREIRTLVGNAEVLLALEYGIVPDDPFAKVLVDATAATVSEIGKRYAAVLVDMRPVIPEKHACALTFLCTELVDGHPSDLGYRRLSRAFWAASQFSAR